MPLHIFVDAVSILTIIVPHISICIYDNNETHHVDTGPRSMQNDSTVCTCDVQTFLFSFSEHQDIDIAQLRKTKKIILAIGVGR